jgi:phenylpyruvate tautomerase PptA (4-oxalocrotonate tautomerase family)
MPVIDVEIVSADVSDGTAVPTQRLADLVGKAIGSAPSRTWVRARLLPRTHYAENESVLDDTELPVFVTVMESRRPSGAALVERIGRVTAAVADALGRREERVHVFYAEDGAGRVAFGGVLVT